MLFHDPFAGHRHWETGEPLLAHSDVYWTEWDYVLADAVSFIQDHTDQHGHLVWEAAKEFEDRVELILERKIDRHAAAEENATRGSAKKPYKGQPGERWVSRLKLYDWAKESGETWPTWSEWYAKENERLGITSECPDQVE